MEKMQSMMSNMKPEDMAKWAGRAQRVSKFAQKPMALYRSTLGQLSSTTILAGLVGVLGVLAIGHMTEYF